MVNEIEETNVQGQEQILHPSYPAVKSFFVNISLSLISVAVLLLFGELIFRSIWKDDFDRWILGPSRTEQKWIYAHYYGDANFRHMYLNYDPDKLNIMGVGDSFTFGEGVPDAREIYLENLRTRLKEVCPAEINNLGRGGLNTSDAFDVVQAYSDKVFPDIVLYGLNPNDILTNEIQAGFGGKWYHLGKFEWLRKHSYLFFDISFRFSRLMEQLSGEGYIDNIKRLYHKNSNEWKKFTEALNSMQDYCTKKNIRLLIAIIPLLISFEEYPLLDAHNQIQEYCLSRNIEFVDILPSFYGKNAQELWVNPYDTHPNAAAHSIIAQGIFPKLSEMADTTFKTLNRASHSHKTYYIISLKRYKSFAINWEKALEFQRLRAHEEPNNLLYRVEFACAYAFYSKMDSSIVEFNTAFRISPNALNFMNGLAKSFYDDERYSEAAKLFKAVLAKDPFNKVSLVNLGISHYRLKNFKDAIITFRKGIELYPKEMEFHINLISLLINLRDYQSAADQVKLAESYGHVIDSKIINILKKAIPNKIQP